MLEKGFLYCRICGKIFQVLSPSGEVLWEETASQSLQHSQTHSLEEHLAVADLLSSLEKGESKI